MGQFIVETKANRKRSSPGSMAAFEALATCKANESRAG